MSSCRASEHAPVGPPIHLAVLPLIVVIAVNVIMSFAILPRFRRFFPGGGALGCDLAVGGQWRVVGGVARKTGNRRKLIAM